MYFKRTLLKGGGCPVNPILGNYHWTIFVFYVYLNPNFWFLLNFFGCDLTFKGPNGLFWGLGLGWKTIVESAHVVELLFFSLVPSILSFDFNSILGSLLTFLALYGLFLGSGYDPKTVLGSSHITNKFCLQTIALSCTFEFLCSGRTQNLVAFFFNYIFFKFMLKGNVQFWVLLDYGSYLAFPYQYTCTWLSYRLRDFFSIVLALITRTFCCHILHF